MRYAQIEEIKKQKYSGSVPTIIGKMESQHADGLYVANGKLSF